MKYVLILVLYSLVSFGQKSDKLTLRILNASVHDGRDIVVQIKNNSNQNYAIVVDTAFYNKNQMWSFKNLEVSLYEKNGSEVAAVNSVGYHYADNLKESSIAAVRRNDTLFFDKATYLRSIYKNGYISSASFITLNAGDVVFYKIPFNLIIKYVHTGTFFKYIINENDKYNARVKHVVSQEFVLKYFRQHEIDVVEKEGYKIFYGELVSNKVPLMKR